jgi:hypothetical protein
LFCLTFQSIIALGFRPATLRKALAAGLALATTNNQQSQQQPRHHPQTSLHKCTVHCSFSSSFFFAAYFVCRAVGKFVSRRTLRTPPAKIGNQPLVLTLPGFNPDLNLWFCGCAADAPESPAQKD